MKVYKLGADPEIFLADAAGALIASCDKIGGSKEEPRKLEALGEGFAVQEDNVALEFNIPASESRLAFRTNMNKVLSFLSDEVAKQGLKFVNLSAASFPKEQLNHPKAMEFGCDPDFNAWLEGSINPRPRAKDRTLRSCGGHVHIGTDAFQSEKDVWEFIKHLDLFLSVPATLMDSGELRKQLYGKAGAFRYKPYGCEYRSLSNFWVLEGKTDWVWDSVGMAMNAWQNTTINIAEDAPLILDAINNNNKNTAERLVEKYKLLVA